MAQITFFGVSFPEYSGTHLRVTPLIEISNMRKVLRELSLGGTWGLMELSERNPLGQSH